MITVAFALLRAMLWMILWFVRTLAIAAILLILIMAAIAAYAMIKGNDDGEGE
ncbi:MAG: hypothetical protein SOI44_00520 [Lactimicrobium sp.]|uniref:hypothetical protein n=1 Tax=Lactimicrobium sp. TaxID=2563780 RepID=UPI002F35F961